MGYQRIVNNLVKTLEKEALGVYSKGLEKDKVQCDEYCFSLHCTRFGKHDVHIATAGSERLLHVWFDANDLYDGQDKNGKIQFIVTSIQAAASLENLEKIGRDGGKGPQCSTESSEWRCTRPNGHTGYHVALREHELLLEIWE
jgi:hypothetical protein